MSEIRVRHASLHDAAAEMRELAQAAERHATALARVSVSQGAVADSLNASADCVREFARALALAMRETAAFLAGASETMGEADAGLAGQMEGR